MHVVGGTDGKPRPKTHYSAESNRKKRLSRRSAKVVRILGCSHSLVIAPARSGGNEAFPSTRADAAIVATKRASRSNCSSTFSSLALSNSPRDASLHLLVGTYVKEKDNNYK